MTNTMTLKDLRPQLPKVIERIDQKFDRYVITRHGKPVAVMMSINDYESLTETLDILEDKEALARIRQGEREIQAGKTRSWREVKRKHAEVQG